MNKRICLDKWFIVLIDLTFLVFSFIMLCSEFETVWIHFQSYSKLVVCYIIWAILTSLYIEKNLLSPNFFFLLTTIYFNCSAVILYALGYDEIFTEYRFVQNIYIYRAVWITIISVCSLHIASVLSKSKLVRVGNKSKKYKEENYELLSYIGLMLIILSIIPFIKEMLNTVKVISNDSYINAYYTHKSTLSTFFLSGIIFLLASSVKKKIYRLPSFIFILIYSLPLFFIGRRMEASVGIIAFFFLYDRLIKKISRKKILICCFFFFFIIFPTISVFRQLSEKNLSTFIEIIKNIENPFYDMLKEGGTTFMSTAYVLYLIQYKGFHFGLEYIFATLSCIPNVVSKFDYFNEVGNPGAWVTSIIAPDIYKIGGGLGFNYIAEAYLNLSLLGVIFIPIVITLILRRLDSPYNKATHSIALSLLIGYILIFSRGSSYDVIRPSVWYIIFPLVIYYFLRKYKKRVKNM